MLTEAGVILGSVPYMSPERTEGIPVDARSGIFSLGSVLYELFSGKRSARANREYPRSPPSSRKIPAPLGDQVPPELEPSRRGLNGFVSAKAESTCILD